jgi:ribulose-5-phosphate 4-epimerase/fuculose-1-phosphate aldolase
MEYLFAGSPASGGLGRIASGLEQVLQAHGHRPAAGTAADLVLNLFDAASPRPHRRRAAAVFVTGLTEVAATDDPIARLYPMLVRSLSNVVLALASGAEPVLHMITPEKGYVAFAAGELDERFFENVYARLGPLASARLVIDNQFAPDLEPALWQGDERTAAIARAGRMLAELQLMPAPFPIEDMLSERELRHLKKMYGIGGLSYGNFSARLDADRFWMSASGVDKSALRDVGRDILLVTVNDAERNAMRLSVPAGVEPRRVSVDAIEHWLIYRENPGVGAILHVHAWMEGVPSTELTYPCGTYELAQAVAELVRRAPDPDRAVVGLRNHGLTITGHDMDEILARVQGRLVRNVPMT